MRRVRALVLAPVLLSGCIATQRDVLDLEQQSDEIKLHVTDLKKSIGSLQANQADLGVKMDTVRRDLSTFTENLKDNQDRMSRLSSKLDDLQAVIEQKVAALGDTLTKQQQAQLAAQRATHEAAAQAQRVAEQAATQAVKAEQAAAKATEQRAVEQAAAASGPTPSQVYHSAYVNFSKGNYDLAAQGFDVYLKKYPKGEVVDLATFYLGQSYFAQGDWENAARQYAVVLDRYPKSDMTPSARLKYAMSLMNMKSAAYSAEAKRYLQSIQDDFPKSPEADAAEKLLKKLDAPPATAPKGKPSKQR